MYCLSCIYETLRLRDIIMFNSKETLTDVIINYRTWSVGPDGTPDLSTVVLRTHLIKAGSRVAIDSSGCSMNSLVYADPHAFKPERWLSSILNEGIDGAHGDEAKAAQKKAHFTGFALGARGCIGKRFAEVEMLSTLR